MEGYNGEDGWVIGEDREYKNEQVQDEADAQSLYNTLEREILPTFFNRDIDGVPREWMKRMKSSVRYCAPRFSMSRQVKDYMNQLYLPAIEACARMRADDFAATKALAAWKEGIYRSWGQVHITAEAPRVDRLEMGDCLDLTAHVFLGSISPEGVAVEIVWGMRDGEGDDLADIHVIPMTQEGARPDGRLTYSGRLCFDANGKFGYAIRILPIHPDLNNRFEMALVKWA